ncbi:MAG: hypothetical protein HYX81_03015 [Chloroflexi bacterium]|nr:hypothetical protein [Chloroflexota bacterium]
MSRKMTVVFHDEELYTDLKVEAARRHIAASDIVAEAVREWLDAREDEELVPLIEAARAEYVEKGGRPWAEVEQEWEEEIARREKLSVVAEKKDVQP